MAGDKVDDDQVATVLAGTERIPVMGAKPPWSYVTLGALAAALETGEGGGSDTVETLTNKTIDGGSNTLTNIPAGELVGEIDVTELDGIIPAANMPAVTGDVTSVDGHVAMTISVGAVTDAKGSLAVKPAVTAVATTNQALTGFPTLDGSTLVEGSIALLTAQTTGSQNGPWVTHAGAWTRPAWYAAGNTTQAFQYITTFVRVGAVYQGSTWRQTAAGPITIDTTATVWAATSIALGGISQALAPTWTAAHKYSPTGQAANTSADGVVLDNPTVASAGNQSFSPSIRWSARGWKTTAVAASQQVDWKVENRPVQGSANPATNLVFSSQVNGAGWVDVLTIGNSFNISSTSINLMTSGASRLSIDAAGNVINLRGVADQSTSVQIPTTGTTVTFANTQATIGMTPAADLAALTVVMPPGPIDKQVCRFSISKNVTTLTVSPNSGQSLLNAPTAVTGSFGGFAWIYHQATATWIRLY